MTDPTRDPLRELCCRQGFVLLRRAQQLSVAMVEATCQASALTPAQSCVLTVVAQCQAT